MKRRDYLATTSALLAGGIAGCMDSTTTQPTTDETTDTGEDTASQTGLLATAVSDNPGDIGDFEKLEVTINEIWVHPKKTEDSGGDEEDADSDADEGSAETTTTENESTTEEDSEGGAAAEETTTTEDEDKKDEEEKDGEEDKDDEEGKDDGEDGPIRIQVDGAKADLVKLQGDARSVINNEELPVGEYEQIKLWVDDEVNAVLNDGSQAKVVTPGNAPLKFNKQFQIKPQTKTTFTADFAPHARGKNAKNGYIIKPVASEVTVEYTEITTTEEAGNETSENETTTAPDGTETDAEGE